MFDVIFLQVLLLSALVAFVSSAPSPGVISHSAQLVEGAPVPVVTATSSQYFARNYNAVVAVPGVVEAYTAFGPSAPIIAASPSFVYSSTVLFWEQISDIWNIIY